MHSPIGDRLFTLRGERGLSQASVAAMLGLKDRQSVQAIESGERSVKAEELLRLAEGFGIPMDHFTDPFLLGQTAEFSCRCHGDADADAISDLQEKARVWIGAYRALALECGELPALLERIGIGGRSSLKDVDAAAERIVRQRFPAATTSARSLTGLMEEEFATVVIMADADPRILGMACRTLDVNAIVVNRATPSAERSRGIAHDLFRILTWDSLPPPASSPSRSGRKQERAERLANRFAETLSGMLPEVGIHPADTPALFGRRFLSPFAKGIAEGKVSVRKAAGVLGVTIDGMKELLESHGLEAAFDL